MRQPRELCRHCGKLRPLKTLYVEYQGETRELEVCRPCGSAIKYALAKEQKQAA